MTTNDIVSPCNGQCVFDNQGFCRVCLRTMDEIVRWATMSDAERRRVFDRIDRVRGEDRPGPGAAF